jgi:hypothetical protein
MMFYGEDLAGRVRRKSDGKESYLGLAEIKAIDKKSVNMLQNNAMHAEPPIRGRKIGNHLAAAR